MGFLMGEIFLYRNTYIDYIDVVEVIVGCVTFLFIGELF